MNRYRFLLSLVLSLLSFSNATSAQSVQHGNDSLVFQFDQNKNFRNSIKDVRKTIVINQKRFDSPIVFEKTVDINGGKYPENVLFYNVHFEDSVSFSFSRFQKAVTFQNDYFERKAGLDHLMCQEMVSFEATKFKSGANLSFAVFPKIANFYYTDFQGIVDFSNSIISDSTTFYFNHSLLPALIGFSANTGFHHIVDFTTANFDRNNFYLNSMRNWHYINLYDSDISEIKIDYQHFRLCFFSDQLDVAKLVGIKFKQTQDSISIGNKTYFVTDYEQIFTISTIKNYLRQIFPTAELNDRVVEVFFKNCTDNRFFPTPLSRDAIISTYEKVLKNFDSEGQKISYETLDIEYRDYKNDWFIVPHIWNCYGYHKEWIFIWSLGFLILFSAISYMLFEKLNGQNKNDGVYHLANVPTILVATSPLMVFKKIWYALMYTSTIFFLINLKTDKLNFKKPLVAYILLMYSVGLLCLGYMANFVLQK